MVEAPKRPPRAPVGATAPGRRGRPSVAGPAAPPATDHASPGPGSGSCSIATTLEVIGDRWTLLILRDVFRGTRRFAQMEHDLGIAKNLLADRLAKLVGQGVLERVPYQTRPVRHEYRLTAKGADLSGALIALMGWGDRWYAADGVPTVLVHEACGTPLELAPRCPTCHETVNPGRIKSRPGPGRSLS